MRRIAVISCHVSIAALALYVVAFRETIGREIELDAVLEERFHSGEHQGESLRGVSHVLYEIVCATQEAGLRDVNNRRRAEFPTCSAGVEDAPSGRHRNCLRSR